VPRPPRRALSRASRAGENVEAAVLDGDGFAGRVGAREVEGARYDGVMQGAAHHFPDSGLHLGQGHGALAGRGGREMRVQVVGGRETVG
jgi:hypothetical protein